MTATEKRNWQMVKNAEMLELEEIIILVTDTFNIHKGYYPDFLLERSSTFDYEEEKEIETKMWILTEGQTDWTGSGKDIKNLYLGFYEWLLDEVFQEQIYEEQDEAEYLAKLTPRQRAEYYRW